MGYRKHFVIGITLIGFSLCSSLFFESIRVELEEYKNQVGKELIINGDTLMIVDYSIVQNNFTLSNGIKINSKLVFED